MSSFEEHAREPAPPRAAVLPGMVRARQAVARYAAGDARELALLLAPAGPPDDRLHAIAPDPRALRDLLNELERG